MSYWTSFISCKSRPFRELIEHLWPQWSIWIGRFHYNCHFPVYNSFKCCVYVCPLVLQSICLHYFPLSYATWNMVEPWQQRIAVAVKVAALNFPSVIMDRHCCNYWVSNTKVTIFLCPSFEKIYRWQILVFPPVPENICSYLYQPPFTAIVNLLLLECSWDCVFATANYEVT